jgi:hypothetical protein
LLVTVADGHCCAAQENQDEAKKAWSSVEMDKLVPEGKEAADILKALVWRAASLLSFGHVVDFLGMGCALPVLLFACAQNCEWLA